MGGEKNKAHNKTHVKWGSCGEAGHYMWDCVQKEKMYTMLEEVDHNNSNNGGNHHWFHQAVKGILRKLLSN